MKAHVCEKEFNQGSTDDECSYRDSSSSTDDDDLDEWLTSSASPAKGGGRIEETTQTVQNYETETCDGPIGSEYSCDSECSFADDHDRAAHDALSSDDEPCETKGADNFVVEVDKDHRNGLEFSSAQVQDDMHIVLEAVKANGLLLEYASENLRNDKAVALVAVQNNGLALQFTSKDLQDDGEVVLAAIKSQGAALKFASDRLRGDEQIVLEAVRQEGKPDYQSSCFQFSSKNLQSKSAFVLEVVKLQGLALEHVDSSLKDSKEILLAAVRNDGRALMYASNTDDADIVLAAVEQEGSMYDADIDSCFQYASKNLKCTLSFVLKAVRRHGPALQYASKELRFQKQVVLEAVKQNGSALAFARSDLKDDAEVVYAAIRSDRSLLRHVIQQLGKSHPSECNEEGICGMFIILNASPRLQATNDLALETAKQLFNAKVSATDFPGKFKSDPQFWTCATDSITRDLRATKSLSVAYINLQHKVTNCLNQLQHEARDPRPDDAWDQLQRDYTRLSDDILSAHHEPSRLQALRQRRRDLLHQRLLLCANAEAAMESATARADEVLAMAREASSRTSAELSELWPSLDPTLVSRLPLPPWHPCDGAAMSLRLDSAAAAGAARPARPGSGPAIDALWARFEQLQARRAQVAVAVCAWIKHLHLGLGEAQRCAIAQGAGLCEQQRRRFEDRRRACAALLDDIARVRRAASLPRTPRPPCRACCRDPSARAPIRRGTHCFVACGRWRTCYCRGE
jgi:hypothetical protein